MTRAMNRTLWTIQVLLSLTFLFTGAMKLILPIAELTKDVALPGPFLRFLGLGVLCTFLPLALGVACLLLQRGYF